MALYCLSIKPATVNSLIFTRIKFLQLEFRATCYFIHYVEVRVMGNKTAEFYLGIKNKLWKIIVQIEWSTDKLLTYRNS